MELLNNNGDVVITDERVPPYYPKGCNGTSICDFYTYYEKSGKYGITKIDLPYSMKLDVYHKNPNGYWILNGRIPEEFSLPELIREQRRKKLIRLKCQ